MMSDITDVLKQLADEKAAHAETSKRLEEALFEIKQLTRKIRGR